LNAILTGVDSLRERFELDGFGVGEGASCVILTPRFRTSRHVIGLLIPSGANEPELVVKMPRLHGDAAGIAREAAVLTALREAWPHAEETVPRVVALANGDRPMLVETALPGPLFTPAMVRDSPSRCIDAALGWLIALPTTRRNDGEASYQRLLKEPLAFLADSFPPRAPERELVARTLELVEPLRGGDVPRVFEHGDLSHPNLIWLEGDRVGVVDWELAEEEGFPLHDLAFFLAFATFALRRPRTAEEHLAAFHDAFFAPGGWSRARVTAYSDKFELGRPLLAPLFIACWARHTARLALGIAGGRPGLLSEEGAAWVRQNRYYALWRHTITHADKLAWGR
jgi:aminoglycoside phosphotransferase (APT) family kinase protein